MLRAVRVGAFGATFMPGSLTPTEAVIYAARPGLRLWKADISGIVHNTLIFTNSSAGPQPFSRSHSSPPTADCTQTETETVAADLPDAQFGLLRVYCGGLLVSYTSTELLVVSPQDAKQIMFTYRDVAEGIVDVAVNRDEIFILRKSSRQHSRPLIRLTQRPSCPRQFASLPVAMSASCVYAEPYREYTVYNVYLLAVVYCSYCA